MAGTQTLRAQASGTRRDRRPTRVIPGQVLIGAQQGIPCGITLGALIARGEIQTAQNLRSMEAEGHAWRRALRVRDLELALRLTVKQVDSAVGRTHQAG